MPLFDLMWVNTIPHSLYGKSPVQEVDAMPRRHEVTFTVPQRPMGNAAILFEVAVDGEDFGDLRIRRGGLDWKPKNAQHRRRYIADPTGSLPGAI